MSGPVYLFVQSVTEFFGTGYAGLFLLSLISSLIVFIPAPYFISVAFLSLDVRFDPNLIIISSALGATLAKVIVFKVSYLGRNAVKDQTRRRLKPFEKLVGRYGFWAAFIASATPIPDDIIYIPMGFANYSLINFVIATLSGKIILTAVVTWGARMLGLPAVEFLVGPLDNPVSIALILVALIGITVMVMLIIIKVDWVNFLGKRFPWTLRG